MNDEQIRILIQAELAGEIRPEQEAELQQALAENPDFQAIYDEERRLGRLFATDRASIEPPAGLHERVCAGVLARATPRRRFEFSRLGPVLAIAASILLVMGVSFWSGRRSTSAGADETRHGILERRDQIVRELPAADRAPVEALFERALERLAESDARHETETGRILEELENEINRRLPGRSPR
ncbi:MAG: hypothetical protein H6807_03400 [Planctomycetes bacterium]|nr:hypothetical protein [Planctomycetota bacterium]